MNTTKNTRTIKSTATGTTHVVVLGGGFAGVLAANRLTQRDDVAVTLVNPRARFVHRLRLHRYLVGRDEAVVDYDDILAEGIRRVEDTATSIDSSARIVTLTGGEALRYDYLVYAVGSGSADLAVPGAAEFAYPMATLEDARRAREALDAAPAGAPVTVVGAGSTGLEVASELADAGRPVTLVAGTVLGAYLHPKARRTVERKLSALGVRVLVGPEAVATTVTRESVVLRGGEEVPSAVTVTTSGFSVPELARRSGLTTDEAGRLVTDESLTSVDDDRIVAAGDASSPSNLPLRMSCQTAVPTGSHAADTVLARMAGTEPGDLAIGYVGQCISLGRRDAVLQFARRDDSARGLFLGGRLVARIKAAAYPAIVTSLTKEARRPGAFRWPFRDPSRRDVLPVSEARPAQAGTAA